MATATPSTMPVSSFDWSVGNEGFGMGTAGTRPLMADDDRDDLADVMVPTEEIHPDRREHAKTPKHVERSATLCAPAEPSPAPHWS